MPGGANEAAPIMPIEEIDRHIRSAHLLSFQPGKGFPAVYEHLFAQVSFLVHRIGANGADRKYPGYASATWKEKYNQWRKFKLDFKDTTDPLEVAKYAHIYPKYLHLVTSGKSLEEISKRIADRSPEYKLLNSDWSILFSDWLRDRPEELVEVKSPVVASKGRFTVEESDLVFSTKLQAERFTHKITLAKIFKERYDSWEFRSKIVGRQIAAEVSLKSLQRADDLG